MTPSPDDDDFARSQEALLRLACICALSGMALVLGAVAGVAWLLVR